MAGLQYQDIVNAQGGIATNAQTGAVTTAPVTSMTPAPTNPSAGQPVVINPVQTTGAPPLQLPQPDTNLATADATVTGSSQTAKTLQDYLNQLEAPKTALDGQNQALMDRLSSLYGSNVGRAQETAKLEDTSGLNTLKKQFADLNSQILTKNAEYLKLRDMTEQNSNLKGSFSAKDTQLARAQAADVGLLQARALGMQGQVQAAQDAVSRAINLKYQGIEEEIAAKEKQLQLIQPQLSQQQAKVAQAQQLMLSDQKDKIAEQKSIQTANANYAISNKIQEPYFYRGNVLVKTSDGTPMFENQGGTLVRLSDGKKYPDSASFFADAGINNWNQINTPKAVATKFETVTLGSGKNNVKVRYGYDAQGQIVSATNLNTGQPMNFHGNGSPTVSSTTTPKVSTTKTNSKDQAINEAGGYINQAGNVGNDGYIDPKAWEYALDKLPSSAVAGFKAKYKNRLSPEERKRLGV